MKNHYKEIAFYKHLSPPFLSSEEELWKRIETRLYKQKKAAFFTLKRTTYALAAVLLLCLAVGCFFRFYSTQIVVPKGSYQVHHLPDGSNVIINAASRLQYHPFWWRFERQVKLEGEAFFEVKTGTSFAVVSDKGTTEVLGTEFNIYSRDKKYTVFCQNGTVRVTDAEAQQSVILEKGEMAALEKTVVLKRSVPFNPKQITGWKENKFAFNATPLPEVLAEIERQYNVRIFMDTKIGMEKNYSAYFEKPASADTTLKILSESLNLKVIKLNIDQYQIEAAQ